MTTPITRLLTCSRCHDVYQRTIALDIPTSTQPLCAACAADVCAETRPVSLAPWLDIVRIVLVLIVAFTLGFMLGMLNQPDKNTTRPDLRVIHVPF